MFLHHSSFPLLSGAIYLLSETEGKSSLSLGASVVLSVTTALVGAAISFLLAVNQSRSERESLIFQSRNADESNVAGLRQKYITPLRYWATLLQKRLGELEQKKSNDYRETSSWFQQLKNHADGTSRLPDFATWSSYEGVFAVTTLYWTSEFLQKSREISYGAPFSELAPKYNESLQKYLEAIRDAFIGRWGLWDSSQEILAELISNGNNSVWNYQDFCRALDSGDRFKIGPLLRPLDYYISVFGDAKENTKQIGSAFKDLIAFLDSQRTPEHRQPTN
jgi:hypothetical protein